MGKELNTSMCCYSFSFQYVNRAALTHMLGKMLQACLMNRFKHTYTLMCPNMCASTHTLTSHQCIIIPKQTIINEPCDAYLSERRQPPPPLPLGWGCHSDRFIDIWRERREGEPGWRGGAARAWRGGGGGAEEKGTSLRTLVSVFQMSLCVSSVNQPPVSVWAQWRNRSWTFLNQASVRRHLGSISQGKGLILLSASQPKKHSVCTSATGK